MIIHMPQKEREKKLEKEISMVEPNLLEIIVNKIRQVSSLEPTPCFTLRLRGTLLAM